MSRTAPHPAALVGQRGQGCRPGLCSVSSLARAWTAADMKESGDRNMALLPLQQLSCLLGAAPLDAIAEGLGG